MTNLKNELHIIEYNQKAEQYATSIDDDIDQLETDTDTLINAVLFAKLGQVHPRILTAKKILTSATAIVKASPNTEFPVELDSEKATQLPSVARLTIFHNGKKLVYVLSIPLLDLDQYKLYRHLSVPVRQLSATSGARFAFIKPAFKYTAISEDYSNFFNLEDINDCKLVEQRYICEQLYPVAQINDDSGCEIQLLVNPQFKNLEQCDIRLKTLQQTYWLRVASSNAWLYATPKPETLYLLCNNHKAAIKT